MRNAVTGDLNFAGLSGTAATPMLPVFNTNWQFFSAAPAAPGAPPVLTLGFKISC
jgi:hypothetical protein